MLSLKSCSKSMKELVMLFECVNKNDTKFPSGGTGRRVWSMRGLFDPAKSIRVMEFLSKIGGI